jgi:hypothetical protein
MVLQKALYETKFFHDWYKSFHNDELAKFFSPPVLGKNILGEHEHYQAKETDL